MVERLGTKANPRITGDFSARPVIELNTCYRMQWAQPQRCEGWASRPEEEKGQLDSSHSSILLLPGRSVGICRFFYRKKRNL
jgi:hypothetical protein